MRAALALALALLACTGSERSDVRESAPRGDAGAWPGKALRVPAPPTGISDSSLPALSDSALMAMDVQPRDAYDSLARSLDSAADLAVPEEDEAGGKDSPPAAVLTLGEFHGDEVADADSTRDWLGLFPDSAGHYRWGRTRIRIDTVRDLIMDEGRSQASGKRVTATVEKDYLILVDGMPWLQEGAVPALDSLARELPPGTRLAFRFLDAEYRLAATVRPPYRAPGGQVATMEEYRLFLTRIRDGVETTRMILHLRSLDDTTPRLGFAGDLDGDGWLDLILDDSPHYNVSHASIYLSRPAEPESFPKRVGSHHSVGC